MAVGQLPLTYPSRHTSLRPLPNPHLHVAVVGGILLQVTVGALAFPARLLGDAVLPLELWPIVLGAAIAWGGAEMISRIVWGGHATGAAPEVTSMTAQATNEWLGFQSVLCPVDFSEQSRRALQYAGALARRRRSALSVLYVNDPLLIAAAAAALHDTSVAKRSGQELRTFVTSAIGGAARTRQQVVTLVATGDPADEILRAATRRRANLIVVGTHGLTGADRLVIGSTALALLQHAAVPVLAVPFQKASPEPEPARDWPGTRIMAAIDLDEESRKEVEVNARVARWFGSSLLLAHVVSGVTAPAWLAGDLSAHDRIAIGRAETQLESLAGSARRLVATETRVVCGRPADELAALVASERISLVTTSLRDRRGWFGTRRGSVSYHVLSHAVAPVLAFPPRWRPQ